MTELTFTRPDIEAANLESIETALRAAYPGYNGMVFDGGRGLMRLMFDELPDEATRLVIASMVTRAPVFGRKITNLFERRPTWNQFSR